MSDTRYPKRTVPGEYENLVDAPSEAAGGIPADDPLAELARLIDEDPFADFNQRRREPSVPDLEDRYAESPTEASFEVAAPETGDSEAENPETGIPESSYLDDYAAGAYGGSPASTKPEFVEPEPLMPESVEPVYSGPETVEDEYAPSYEQPADTISDYTEPTTEYADPATDYDSPAAYQAPEEPHSEAVNPELRPDPGFPDGGHPHVDNPETDYSMPDNFAPDSTDRIYADLAAASQRVEPRVETNYPATAADPRDEAAASLDDTYEPTAFDPVAELEASLLSNEAVARESASPEVTSSGSDLELGDLDEAQRTAPSDPEARTDSFAYEDNVYKQTDPVFDNTGHVPPYGVEGPEEPTGRRRGTLIVAGLVGLVVVGGAAAIGYRSLSGGESNGPPPVIHADKGPSKVQPQAAGAEETPQQGKLVYDRVGGDNSSDNAQLVSREEAVADVGNRQVRVIDPNQEEANGLRGTAAEQAAPGNGVAAADDNLPKRVRTVVVKPDGTIVGEIQAPKPAITLQPAPLPTTGAAAELPAASATLPESAPATELAAAPAAAALPVAESAAAATALSPNTQPADQQPAEIQSGDNPPDGAASETLLSATQPGDTPLSDAGGVPLPTPRPADLARSTPRAPTQAQANQPGSNFVPPSAPSASGSGQPLKLQPAEVASLPVTQPAAPAAAAPAPAAPAPAAAAPATTTFPAGSYVVQVAASRNEQDARGTAASINQRYANVLSGLTPAVERADLGDRGIYYRVGIGPMESQGSANTMCSKLKSAGLDCFVRRN